MIMSLDWQLDKINNYENLCWLENEDGTHKLNTVTNSLIWLTMGIGINRISVANADEFYSRVVLYEKINKSMQSIWHEDGTTERIYISDKDVYDHIGLWTNASSFTVAQFRKRMFDTVSSDAKRTFANYLKSLDKETVDE
jgi:hypothetical protein